MIEDVSVHPICGHLFLGPQDKKGSAFTSIAQVAQTVKNPSAVQETQVQSLGREDPLEVGMAPTPISLPGESHGQRNLGCCSLRGRRVRHNGVTEHTHTPALTRVAWRRSQGGTPALPTRLSQPSQGVRSSAIHHLTHPLWSPCPPGDTDLNPTPSPPPRGAQTARGR